MKTKVYLALLVCFAAALSALACWGATVAEQVRDLREQQKDYKAAEALAEEFLRAHPQLDLERQQVQFELGKAQYAAKDYAAATATLRALVADYSNTALDKTAEAFVVDDAQFYVGAIEHYFGDRAKGIEAYEKAIADFPKSNRRAQALMLLAGVHEQDGDKAKALARFQQLVAEHPTSEQAPEAELHVGHLLRDEGKLNEAIAAFQRVATDWPDSPHAPTALLFANRALIAQELVSAKQADSDEQVIKNEAAIGSNLDLLMTRYADSDLIAQAMQDQLNYYSSPHHWLHDEEAGPKIEAIVTWLRENKPDTRQGMRALCEYALTLGPERSDEALFWLDWVSDIAETGGDESLLFDAQFTKGRILRDAERIAEARDVWTALLEADPKAPTADELKVMLALLLHKEGRYDDALKAFNELANDPMRREDIRSTALYMMADIQVRTAHFEEAVALLDKILTEYPETLSAKAAKAHRPVWARLAEVPKENRGK